MRSGSVDNGADDNDDGPEQDTSWRWMIAIAVAIGLFAWFTR
jgi:hypothetical protein